jgi:DNA-binding protein HU-beta
LKSPPCDVLDGSGKTKVTEGLAAFAERGDCRNLLWQTSQSHPKYNTSNTSRKEKSMTKSELIDAIAIKAELDKVAASRALSATLESITDSLKSDDKVALIGFGTFSVSHRGARTGKNPLTGEILAIPASRAAKFKAGKRLKEALGRP